MGVSLDTRRRHDDDLDSSSWSATVGCSWELMTAVKWVDGCRSIAYMELVDSDAWKPNAFVQFILRDPSLMWTYSEDDTFMVRCGDVFSSVVVAR